MITINNPTDEPTFLEYVDKKNQVKGAVKSIANALISLQDIQSQFDDFLTLHPEYEAYYNDSVSSIPNLSTEFERLNTIAIDWIETTERIKNINPLF